MHQEEHSTKWFISLCLLHVFIWTLTNIVINYNAPLDVAEAIAWGQEWQWGYDRDPYLVAWVSQLASLFGNGAVWPIHLLAQGCVVLSFWAIWKLSQAVGLSKVQSFISVLILEGVFYYNITTGEFNDNVLQLPLWALTIYCYYSAITKQEMKYWLGTGAFLGLALMAKYFSVMLIIPMLIILLTPEGRKSFKNIGFYAGALLGLMIILPNIIWLVKNNFQYVNYALSRSSSGSSWVDHVWFPVKFFFSQWLAIGPAILLYVLVSKSRWQKENQDGFNTFYLLVMGLGPAIMTIVYSLIMGDHIRSMWGTPLWGLVGVLCVFFTRPSIDQKIFKHKIAVFGSYFALGVVGALLSIQIPPYFLGYTKTSQYPSPDIAKYLTKVWHDEMDKPLKYVAGTRQIVARVTAYSDDHPRAYFNWNQAESPWISEADMLKNGAMFVWDVKKSGEHLPKKIRERFPDAKELPNQTFSWHTGAQIKPVTIGVAILGG